MAFDPTIQAAVQVPDTADIAKVVRDAGGDPAYARYASGWLFVRGIPQQDLEAALGNIDLLFVPRMSKKADALREMKQRINAGMPFLGKIADMDEENSIQRINGAVITARLAKAAGQNWVVPWRMRDNSFINLNADLMIALGLNVSAYYADIRIHYWSLTDAAMAAQSQGALDAIDVTAGWPAPPADPPIPS